jgi:uncharacterized protein (DUF58 family)
VLFFDALSAKMVARNEMRVKACFCSGMDLILSAVPLNLANIGKREKHMISWRAAWQRQAQNHKVTQSEQGVSVSLDELLHLRVHAAGLNLAQQRQVMSLMAGGYHSGFRGRGFDFAETRHYQAGDDIRTLDWRVTARYGIPHTKVFQEERERPVLILTDYTPSMYFGTRVAFKSVIAARAAAMLTWAAVVRGDRVGGAVFTGAQQRELRPTGGRRGALRLLHYLAELHSQTGSAAMPYDLNHALAQARRVARPGSLVCIISDFHALHEEGEKALQALAKHTNVLGLFIYDALEATLPPPGRYVVSDGTQRLNFDSGAKSLREAYQRQFATRYVHLQELFLQRGLRLLALATDASLPAVLRAGLGRVETASGNSHAAPLPDVAASANG